jgi:DNA invertase Pin-like site-specific DNA recombinase
MIDLPRSPKLQGWHLDRVAIVYVRQSTPQQVAEHHESTARQYALADRAAGLGWARDRVTVIDDDLGKSGQSIEGRPGFQRLLAEVALDRVGLILGLEMSRLARSNKDWHQLLELCARFRVLLGDADGLYDPTDHNDRLLLGLHGMMSAAEIHVLKERMYQGKLHKARRGELFGTPPIGYVRSPGGGYAIDPDEQVQAVVRLVFDQFDRHGTAHGLLRYLVAHRIQIPVRAHGGPDRGQLEWRRPNRETLQNLLHNPTYAGAYCYGHRAVDPKRQQPGRPTTGKRNLPPEECLVLIRDRLPAYITWDRFQANRARLAANQARYAAQGPPRAGAALLNGLLRCGRCGRRLQVRYGANGYHWYGCTRGMSDYGEPLCQSLSGRLVDQAVADQLLAAVEPAALEASLLAVADVERERAALARHWQLRRERARYEADRAERQYRACEPENRLVGRTLEARWEAALQQVRQLDDEYERWQRAAPARVSDADRDAIRALARDLPAVWRAEATGPADRQRIARLLLDEVRVTVDRSSERVDVDLVWAGGHTSRQTVLRPVARYDRQADYPRLVARLRDLCARKWSSAEIAEALNDEGYRPPKRTRRFTGPMVLRLTAHLGLARRERHGGATGLGANEYRPMQLARRLGVSRDTVRGWVRRGWVTTRSDDDGHHVIWADADELRRLRQLPGVRPCWANKERLAELRRPKPRPEPEGK